MDEYQIGEVAIASDGRLYRFRGGDPLDKANWDPADNGPPEAGAGAEVPPPPAPRAGGTGQAVLDYLQMISQGITGKAGDEIAGLAALVPGGMTPEEAIRASRRATAGAVARHPIGAPIAEGIAMAGTAALAPAAIGTRAVQSGAGLLGPLLGGTLAGAAEGGVIGAMGAEGGVRERLDAAALPAAFGAGFGLLSGTAAPVANALFRRAAGRGSRVASALRETSGITDDINVTRQAAEDAVEAARASGYRSFEAMPPVSRMDVATSRLPTAIKDRLPKTDLSFTDLQDLRMSLRAADDEAGANALSKFMAQHFPGLPDADAAYAAARNTERVLDSGTKAANKSGADIEWLTRNMGADDSRTFRTGLVQKSADALTMRDEQAGALLKQLMDQGDAGARKVRQYFPQGPEGDRAFQEFRRILAREESAEKVGATLRRLVPAAVVGLGLGAGASSFFR